jgi:hypothetical protein
MVQAGLFQKRKILFAGENGREASTAELARLE